MITKEQIEKYNKEKKAHQIVNDYFPNIKKYPFLEDICKDVEKEFGEKRVYDWCFWPSGCREVCRYILRISADYKIHSNIVVDALKYRNFDAYGNYDWGNNRWQLEESIKDLGKRIDELLEED